MFKPHCVRKMVNFSHSSHSLSRLSLKELERLHAIVKKWGIYSDEKEFERFKDSIMPDARSIFSFINKPIFDKIKNECPWLLNDDAMASASAAFIGVIIFRIIYNIPRNEADLDIDISIIMIYLTADHVLDDNNSSDLMKNDLKQLLRERPDTIPEHLDKEVKAVYKEFLFLTSKSPYAEEALLEAWGQELESEKQHYESDIKKLWDISCKKGGACTIMTCKILRGAVYEDCYELGAITQLIDDLCDMKIDIKENIKTCATELSKINELDRYIYDIFVMIDALSDKFWILKILFTLILCSLAKRREAVSSEVKNIICKYTIFDKSYDSHVKYSRKQLYC